MAPILRNHMPTDKAPALIVQHPRAPVTLDPRDPPVSLPEHYVQMQAEDSYLAEQMAETIADTHIARYLGRGYTDLAGLPRFQASWYRSLGAFALRYCRSVWRRYAVHQALNAAERAVDTYCSYAFREPDGAAMSLEKRRHLLSLIVNHAYCAYRESLDGSRPIEPGVYLDLEARKFEEE